MGERAQPTGRSKFPPSGPGDLTAVPESRHTYQRLGTLTHIAIVPGCRQDDPTQEGQIESLRRWFAACAGKGRLPARWVGLDRNLRF